MLISAAIVVVSPVAELLKSQFECHLPFVFFVENLLRDLIDRESGKQSSNSLLHSLCSLEVCSRFLSVLLFSWVMGQIAITTSTKSFDGEVEEKGDLQVTEYLNSA